MRNYYILILLQLILYTNGILGQEIMRLDSEEIGIKVQVGAQNPSCTGKNDGKIWASVSGGTAPYQFQWSFSDTEESSSIEGLSSGEYFLWVKDASGLQTTTAIYLTEPNPIDIKVSEILPSYCDQATGCLKVKCTGGTGKLSHYWEYDASEMPILKDLAAGNYTVFVTDEQGCMAEKSMEVQAIPPPKADFYLIPTSDYPILLESADCHFINQSQNADKFTWIFSDGTSTNTENFQHSFTDFGEYKVTLIAYNSSKYCPDTLSKTVQVIAQSHTYLPNSFSPDGDGINDIFEVKGENIAQMELIIYDHKGKKIKTLHKSGDFWDGKDHRHREMPEGIYYYTLDMQFSTGEVKQGTATFHLLRGKLQSKL